MLDWVSLLPNWDPSSEGFFAMLLFRRKWLIRKDPAREEFFREHFRADEICLGREVLRGGPEAVQAQLEHLLCWLRIRKPRVIKGGTWFVKDLWDEYPHAISLVITYEPRGLEKAAKSFLAKAVKEALDSWSPHLWRNLDKEWHSAVHRCRRSSGPRFVLLDFDYPKGLEPESTPGVADRVVEDLMDMGLAVSYAVTTPGEGFHVLVEADKVMEDLVFRRRKVSALAEDYGVDLEIKTGQSLTHLPGVNPYVRVIHPSGVVSRRDL